MTIIHNGTCDGENETEIVEGVSHWPNVSVVRRRRHLALFGISVWWLLSGRYQAGAR